MDLKAISELRYTFVIPYLQRGYKWTPDNIRVMLNDFKNFIDSGKQLYCLQPIAIVEDSNDKNRSVVVDGQQRLTTLFLLWKYLIPSENLFGFEFERDKESERKKFLNEISGITSENETNIDFFYISRAYLTIKEWFHDVKEYHILEEGQQCVLKETETIDCVKEEFIKLLKAQKEQNSVQVLWYIVDEKKKHDVFSNINSGKIQLGNSDLIKALLLNSNNGIENHKQLAVQFELMERQLAEDKFWFMLKQKDIDPLKGQSRMDLLFNMVADIKLEDYQNEARKSFFKFSDYSSSQLLDMWKKVREKYQRLRDLFENPYTFHYVGFLTYCGVKLQSIVKLYEENTKGEFIEKLHKEIKKKLSHDVLSDYSYYDTKDSLRKLFVLHNIETVLSRYEKLEQTKDLQFAYENFPFELLYRQSWNIEHIASHTDNTLKTPQDRKDWIESVFVDFKSILQEDAEIAQWKEKTEEALGDKNEFDKFYKSVVEKINDNPLTSEDEKNGIGNLVLLDEHTNKSFHNSLFPRKRRIVIMASGLRNKCDTEHVETTYVPLCTQQVYTKSYNKQSNVNLNCWSQEDSDAYFEDMREKLNKYFEKE